MATTKLLPHLADSLNKLRALAVMKGYEGDRAQQRSIDIDGVLQAAEAMIEKLGVAQEKGRSGWHDPERCDASTLLANLLEHLLKGDPVDWLNFSMMIWFRKDEFSDELWQEQLKSLIDGFCRQQLQEQYAVMEEVYQKTTAEQQAEVEAAAAGSLLLDDPLTIFGLVSAQKAINDYLTRVFSALSEAVPASATLITKVTFTEGNGVPQVHLSVEATP